jgi:hypothetical protein
MAVPNGHANGEDHPAAATDSIFAERTRDLGTMPGLGHVILHEAPLFEVWPYLGKDDNMTFGLRVLAASVEIEGRRFTFEELSKVGMRHMTALQKLLPEVRAINGIIVADEEDDAQKKDAAAAEGDTQAASQSETAS